VIIAPQTGYYPYNPYFQYGYPYQYPQITYEKKKKIEELPKKKVGFSLFLINFVVF
jgi:hypothetical protein